MGPFQPYKHVADTTWQADLANEYIDKIQIKEKDDFKTVSEALKSLTEPNKDHKVPDSLKGRIEAIKEILDSPEMYVKPGEDTTKFKEVILKQIAWKIEKLSNLSDAQKTDFLRDQEKFREKTAQNQAKLASSAPPLPGTEAHTVTHEQWLQEQQQAFNSPANPSLLLATINQLPPVATQEEIDQLEASIRAQLLEIQNSNPTIEQLSTLLPALLNEQGRLGMMMAERAERMAQVNMMIQNLL